MNKTLSLFLAIALCFVVSQSLVQAQQRIQSSPSTMGCFRQPVTPISQVLNLHSDMPLDCIIGYIYFDSLCRGIQSYQQLDSMINRITSWDTMRVMMRFLYRMQEYDADLFREYEFGAAYLNSNYHITPAMVVLKFWQRMNIVLGARNKYSYLTMVPSIIHLKVLNVQTTYDSLAHVPFPAPPRKCVTAIILDTIKGLHLRGADSTSILQSRHNKGAEQTVNPLINIMYSPFTPKSFGYGDNARNDPQDTSTGFRCDSCYGQNAMQVGKEYVVFLENLFLDFDGTYSYYEYTPYSTYNSDGGIFPIDANGNVLIIDNYFGYGNTATYQNFKDDLKSDIQSIISH